MASNDRYDLDTELAWYERLGCTLFVLSVASLVVVGCLLYRLVRYIQAAGGG